MQKLNCAKITNRILRPNNFVYHRFSYLIRFARVDKKISILDLTPYLIYSIFKNSQYRKKLLLTFRISRLHTNQLIINNEQLPPIEIIINSVKKDFLLLNHVIKHAVANSVNLIKEVKVIVPLDQVELCKSIINKHTSKVSIISEENFLNDNIRSDIKKYFPLRYGWVIQQFITLDAVLNSTECGVLQLNSDTILLRPMKWLNNNQIQILSSSHDYHRPYYTLLNKLNNLYTIQTDPHVTHHMLFQPNLLKKILLESNIESLSQLLTFVIKNFENDTSPMCVEYELYAQGMLIYFEDNLEILKFGNVSCQSSNNMTVMDFEKIFLKLAKKYNSVSFHSYQALN